MNKLTLPCSYSLSSVCVKKYNLRAGSSSVGKMLVLKAHGPTLMPKIAIKMCMMVRSYGSSRRENR